MELGKQYCLNWNIFRLESYGIDFSLLLESWVESLVPVLSSFLNGGPKI